MREAKSSHDMGAFLEAKEDSIPDQEVRNGEISAENGKLEQPTTNALLAAGNEGWSYAIPPKV
jgi:hypothetical protein